ncbi:MAG: polysaccharide deacetylase family protein [Gemmataceae bacterium]|nr:polysaccharide deacetylase family protein [Gemmataceae bacterium]
MMKRLAKSTLCALWKYSGVMAAQETMARWSGRSSMAILLFHRVTDEIPRDGLTVPTAWFRELCELLERRFHVVSMNEFERIRRARENPPQRTVAIHFDDCYRDNLSAARALAEHNLPATFFIPTQFVGTDHVFDWDRDLKRMPNLTWDDVRDMVALGHDIGSHSVSHADFGAIDETQARRELIDSKRTLEEQIGRPVRWFAYPFGLCDNFRPEYLPLVRDAGYEACFSGYGGFVDARRQQPISPRVPAPSFDTVLNLELHLTGCLDWFYALKRQAGVIS